MEQPAHLAASLLAAAVLSLCLAQSAKADIVINFDNLTAGVIPNGYEGFNWNNFDVLNSVNEQNLVGPNGYTNGTVSQPNVAFNGSGLPASMTGTTPFTFSSAYFTAAWNTGLSITVEGLLNGITEDTATFIVNTTGPTLKTFNWTDINELDFSSSGGTSAGYLGAGEQFAMDNMTLSTPVSAVPEPGSWALLGTVLALSAVIWRRRPMRGAE